MAETWPAKAVAEVVERRWAVPLPSGDAISTIATSASGATVDRAEEDGCDAVLTISGGVAGTPATITVTVVTLGGFTLAQSFILPVRAQTRAFTTTARDVCDFALRKITGMGVDADATELDDALERLNDMLALWRIDGLDVGLGVLVAGTELTIPDEFTAALKFNLRVACHDAAGAELSGYDMNMADTSKRLIGNRLFTPASLTMPANLANQRDSVASLF